jgi:hypothetical protein
MSLNNIDILKIVLKNNRELTSPMVINTDYSKYYETISGMSCFNLWCYKVSEESLKLSDLKVQRDSVKMTKIHKKIEEDILENSFDYNKGMITVTSDNLISDGHHRYFILKKNFGDNYEIKVRKMLNVKNPFSHLLFITLVVRPLKLISRLNPLQFFR